MKFSSIDSRDIVVVDYFCDYSVTLNGLKVDTSAIDRKLNKIIFNKSNNKNRPSSFKNVLVLINNKNTIPSCNDTFRRLHKFTSKAIQKIHIERAIQLGIPYNGPFKSKKKEMQKQDPRIFLNVAIYEPPFFREIAAKLPPWPKDTLDISSMAKRNILIVSLDSTNTLFVSDEVTAVNDLNRIIKRFIINPDQNPMLSENPSKALIRIETQLGTRYESYIEVYNIIRRTYEELRDDLSRQLYNANFEALDFEKQKDIKNRIPIKISEAEPG